MDKNSRRMIYPYTLGAKMSQFPFKLYWDKNPFFKYYYYGIIVTVPFFYFLTKLSNSPANYEKFREQRKRDEEAYKKHLEHQL